MKFRFCLILTAAAATAACDSPPAHQAIAATTASVANMPAKDSLIVGTPAGDLGDWVSDIRKGIAALPAHAAKDAAAAQRSALELYVTRQEYLEMYYGVDGRMPQSTDLANAIEIAETRFHEVLKLLTTPAPSVDDVKKAVDALDKQQLLVADLWKKSGLHLDRSTP